MASRLGLFLSMAAAAVALAACGGGGPSPLTLTPLASPTARPLASPTAPPATSRASPLPSPLTPTPTPARSPTLSPTPAASPTAAVAGAPFSFADLQRAWADKGIQATAGGASSGFSGFGVAAFEARALRGSDSLELSVFVYRDSQAVKEDWELTSGEAPKAKSGRSLPASLSIWWNENIIVVVRARTGEMGADAFAAFLALGGPPGSPSPTPARSPTPAPTPTPAR